MTLLLASAALASVASELAFHRGVVAFGDGNFDAARAEFEKVVADDPEDASAIQYLGMIAQQQGDFAGAIEQFDSALSLEPDNAELRLDRATVLLELGRIDEAKVELDGILAEHPDDARANLFAGVADYRLGDYEAAIVKLDRAKQLDPTVSSHATYYAGLSAAFLGNFAAAEGAFSAVEEQSPLSPLGASASDLRQSMSPTGGQRDQRPWSLALTAGIEWDSNPTFAGVDNPVAVGLRGQDADFRGVFRIRGSYDLYDKERYSVTAGYDGYLSLHQDVKQVDLQTHVGWLSGTANFDPFRFGLRYDYGFTMIDLTDNFRHLHRITPSVTYRESDWGVLQGFFQWQNANFLQDFPDPFNRDGNRYAVGVNQFIFLPEPFTYVRIGGLGEFERTDSEDFSYDGFELSSGASGSLLLGVQATVLYRFIFRDYLSRNSLPVNWGSSKRAKRKDRVHRLTLELVRPFGEHIELSFAGSYDHSNSNIDFYHHDRWVVGSYASYRF
jgi:tetratricopeptide (TPR) repeat protein